VSAMGRRRSSYRVAAGKVARCFSISWRW
jgi:hypothetical protein